MKKQRIITIELPDTEAIVDLPGENVCIVVTVDRKARTVRIVAQAKEEESDSTWTEKEMSIDIEKKN